MKKNNQVEQEIKVNKFKFNWYFWRAIELYIWIFLWFLPVFPAYYTYTSNRYYYDKFNFLDYYNQFLFGIFLILSPLLFKLIFGKLPFEYLRDKKEWLLSAKERNNHYVVGDADSGKNSNIVNMTELSLNEVVIENYALQYINESNVISERIFLRSGVYLLVGCLIAFIGVAIFYSPIFETTKSLDISQRLLDYLPRFWALFFIEFIAFFFLRQYRIMLEEYRYYEAIKRKRQDNFNLLELVEKYKENVELLKLLIENTTQTYLSKLSDGETTQILETQKAVNQDLDIFTKFTDLIKEIKNR